jgi:hypothetical protein
MDTRLTIHSTLVVSYARTVVSVWTGLGRTALWKRWERYEERGIDAIYEIPALPQGAGDR